VTSNYRSGAQRVENLARVRKLRRGSTDAERALWRLLRSRRFANWKFRRQHEFGPFVLDFFCRSAMLALEVDGGGHYSDEQIEADQRRTAFLERNGIQVLRFSNLDVLKEPVAVATILLRVLLERSPHPDPLPEGEGE
jgi:very-short-patch-repair endonuclease